jgi:AcrR family transcriptional regulator
MTSDRGRDRGHGRADTGRGTRGRGGSRAADERSKGAIDKVVEKLDAKAEKLDRVAAKMTKKADKLDRVAKKTAAKAEVLDRIGEGLGRFDLWTRAEPTPRRPRFTRDDITAAAVRIADAEGFDALSMRKLATELDAGTMTLYHYVHTKDELLTLAVDAVMSEVVLGPDDTMPTHWRDALVMLAERSRASIIRHQWILDLIDDPGIGPNSVRHFDETLEAVASLDIDLVEKLDITSLVDQYVFGWCAFEREAQNAAAVYTGVDRAMLDYVSRLVDTGDYPQLAALRDEYGLEDAWGRIQAHHRDSNRFRRNLEILLDGIEANLERRGVGGASPDRGPSSARRRS